MGLPGGGGGSGNRSGRRGFPVMRARGSGAVARDRVAGSDGLPGAGTPARLRVRGGQAGSPVSGLAAVRGRVPRPHSRARAPLSPLQVLGDRRRAGAVCGRLELRPGAAAGAGPAVPVGLGRWAGPGRAGLGSRCWPRSPPTLQRAPRLGPRRPCGSGAPSAADLRPAAARHCPPGPPRRGCLGPPVPAIR